MGRVPRIASREVEAMRVEGIQQPADHATIKFTGLGR